MRFPGFIGASYKAQSVNVDCQRCVNLYPETTESKTGKEQEVGSLVQTPGLKALLTLPNAPVRGVYATSTGLLFAVGKDKLYSINDLFEATEIGTLNTTAGKVSMADNGLHLMIVDGPSGYAYSFADSTFTQITDDGFLGGDIVVYQDGYFIVNRPGTGQFCISGLLDITFDAGDFATSEGSPDAIISLISNARLLWVFNETTTEVFYNSGDDFPFTRTDGAFIQVGCAAKFSVAKIDNAVFWLTRSSDGGYQVYMASGLQPQRVSTHPVETEIQRYENAEDAVAYTYQENGHNFYVLNFPSARTTWVFDTATGLWHERVYQKQGVLDRHRSETHAYLWDKHIVSDFETGQIYEMKSNIYSDDGVEILRERIAPHASAGMKRMFFNSFQLDIETGTGLDGIQQGTDPQAMLTWSDDGGHTWSNEHWVSFGKIGKTKARALWRRLGSSRDRVFKIRISDPVKVCLIGAEIDVATGAS
jgi:hypothetical protein